MVDFPHQLLRSYIFLKNLFPESNHIVSTDFTDANELKNLKGSFIYVTVNDFNKINDINYNLITNLFSFGEMKRETFKYYFDSDAIKNSENILLVNRFVSSPFFEQTYDTDINVLDYINLKSHKINYFDVFPIGHYYTPFRLLYDLKRDRPISSPYFECVLKRK